ncbi:unnamed protein product [Acanthoscelides obtectus]|uniref:Tonsoku-like protein n=2 Tax=Acanthoscelides obtectus TaxID=200917 RepID=A0A9P0M6E8_ACAOB|nr:unnamed protein product [Acanthoscelides obtectus]CAK1660144.1 Tonsoku-like protein [Acanthoscelides obtectus]
MLSRLYTNLGLVKEIKGQYNDAADLIKKSIGICKPHDIYEQLTRNYLSMAGLCEKIGDNNEAIRNYNLCIDVAKKVKSKVSLLSTALLAKSELLVRLTEYHGAKTILQKAYKLKGLSDEERKNIGEKLKVVVCMCQTEDKLVVSSGDHKELKILYEKMGDAACIFQCYQKAVEYYTMMLEHAQKSGGNDEELKNCYFSLAETYKDNGDYFQAIYHYEKEYELCKELKDGLNTLSNIADTKEMANLPLDDVKAVYERAFESCRAEKNLKEERRMVSRYIIYLNRNEHKKELDVAYNLLKSLGTPDSNEESSSSDSDSEDSQTKLPVGADIDLDELQDVSDNSDEETYEMSPNKKRSKRFTIKKNEKGETQLHTACIHGHLQVVRHLLDLGHPVNVRDFSGWMPLHEACNHGHLEVVKLLVEKGAAVNDRGGTYCGGITPLYDAARNAHLQIIEYLLDHGASVNTKTDDGDTTLNILKTYHGGDKIPEDQWPLYFKLIERLGEGMEKAGQKAEPCPRSRSFGFVDEDDDPPLERSSRCSNKNKSAINGTKEVRDSSTSKRSALVTEEENILYDDWLVVDVPNKPKRRRTSSSLTRTSSIRSDSPMNRKSVSPAKKRVSDEFLVPDDYVEENEQDYSWISPLNSTYKNRSQESKRKRQVSLLDSGFSKDRSTGLSISQKSIKRNNSGGTLQQKQAKLTKFTQATNPVVQEHVTREVPERAVVPQISTCPQTRVEDEVRFVDILVENITFRIAVMSSQIRAKNIGWLAEQAALKYERKECKKPVLELQSSTGALLSDSDPLQMLFVNGRQAESVVGKVVKVILPPLVDRYKEMCAYLNVDVEEDLCTKLEEVFTSLSLQDNGMFGESLTPLCKAINHQSSLLELNLSGNSLDIETFQTLCLTLPTLTNLMTLNLRNTGLTLSHLHHMAFLETSCQSVLKNLTNLDLSDNPLGNQSLHCLSRLTERFTLTHISLSNVKLVSPLRLGGETALHLSEVVELDISNNCLNESDLAAIFQRLTGTKVTSLNLSNNDSKDVVGALTRLLEMPSLRVGIFSRCNVNDRQLDELLRFSTAVEMLELSYNPLLTGISLKKILECSNLRQVHLVHCDGILVNCDVFEVNKFLENSGIRNLVITSDIDEIYPCHDLIEAFQRKYSDSVVTKTESYLGLRTG